MKVVINTDYGGFSLSSEALELLAEKKGEKLYWFTYDYTRSGDDRLIPLKSFQEHKGLFGPIAYTISDPDNRTKSFSNRDIPRDDPDLVSAVEELGDRANGRFASLSVVEIPDDVEWCIEEYDGSEWIAEVHRTWR